MAHFARIDENNLVVDVVVVPNDEEHRGYDFLVNDLGMPGQWIQTSYNDRIRRRFARIGFGYDPVRDAFIEPCPYAGWILDENHDWQPPVSKPTNPDAEYIWSESKQEWIEIRRKIGDTTIVVLGGNDAD